MRASEMSTRGLTASRPATRAATEPPLRQRAGPQTAFVLGRYRLHRRLGSGAFGTVWAARDERLDRDVAIKIIPRGRIMAARFEREARAAARLSHPGIVRLYEAAVDEEDTYLVSELVRGKTMEDLLDSGQLSDRDVVAIGIALCDALAHAHAQDVIHRDVKPSNVLVPAQPAAPSEVAKITDFGVARFAGGDSLTRTGDVLGTAGYMSPEQAEGLVAGPAADLYSLALVVYEALTGVNPIGASTAAQRARRLGAHLPPLRRQRRDLPRELGHGVDLALRPRPRERGTVAEFRMALASALEQVEDRPGVVAPAWPARATEGVDQQGRFALPTDGPPHAGPQDPQSRYPQKAQQRDKQKQNPDEQADRPPESQPQKEPLPERAVGAIATAGLTAWICSHLMPAAPFGPAALATAAAASTLVLPRLGWLFSSATVTVALSVEHHSGAAIILAMAATLPVVLIPRSATRWSLPAAAPVLGLLWLAGAWPALAARAAGLWRRAGLALIGWVWLVVAQALTGAELYTRRPPGIAAPSVWTVSPFDAVHHVLTPILSAGLLLPGAAWAAGALALPYLVNRRSFTVEIVLVTVWAATVASASSAVIRAVHPAQGVVLKPSAVASGAVASGVVALWPAAMRARRRNRHLADMARGLA